MIRGERSAGFHHITLDRPEVGNALSPALVDALDAELAQAFDAPDVHTLVLAGNGRHLCTGFDLSDLAELSDGDLLARFVRIESLLQRLWHAPVRTIAFAGGRTWGAGADLFACCDLRVARPDASFTFPGARFGIVLGTRRLAERLGTDRARRCVSEGETLSAEAALACGLATAIDGAEPMAWCERLPAPAVDRETLAAVRAASRQDGCDHDLAALVRSAMRPGLKQRIVDYRQAQRAAKEKQQ